ncbi:hypothetical protein COCON_G00199880 [Conger conger]|uniref:Uncharacterized protein n=1 Tax=Conger conger TaxID=82655 RepID=A0A9Q1D2J1_CONCO|nr:hypothetical protein COCON_G00199880 [Conger conger]
MMSLINMPARKVRAVARCGFKPGKESRRAGKEHTLNAVRRIATHNAPWQLIPTSLASTTGYNRWSWKLENG